jgi:hypothetical protein
MMMKEAEKTINLVNDEEEDAVAAAVADKNTDAADAKAIATEGEEAMEKKPAAALTEDEIQEAVKDWSGYGGTFKGYMAWALWGHIPKPGLEAYKSIKFSTSDEAGDKAASGRKASRKKKAVEEDIKRSHTAGRGLSAADAITVDDVENRKETKQVLKYASDTMNYDLRLKQIHKKIAYCDMDIAAWYPSVVANQSEIFGNGGANHQHWYDTFPPYRMWCDARAKKEALIEQTEVIAEKATQQQEAAAEQESKNMMSVKAKEQQENAEEENTTIPSQIQVSRHSTDDVLPKLSNTSMEEV